MDCTPSIKTTGGKRASVLVVVDDFSKFCLLHILPDLTSAAVATAFLTHVLCVYGKPRRVRVDQGSEFLGDFAQKMRVLGVEVSYTCPVSPWTNGITERMIGFMKTLVRKVLVGVNKEAWE